MGGNVTIAAVVGGRPNLMKMAPVLRAVEENNRASFGQKLTVRLIHTGLPNDPRLNDTSWGDVQMPKPEIHLGVGAGSASEQSARTMLALDRYFGGEPVDGVIVVGDGEAALAGTLVAAKRGVPVFHVEAGLRSGDLSMPEEINRVVIDSLSARLFTPSEDASENLLRAGCDGRKVICVGNVMIDNLYHHLERCKASDVLQRLGLVESRVLAGAASAVATIPKYVVASLSRPETVDRRELMAGVLQTVSGIARTAPVIFPMANGLRKRLDDWGLDDFFTDLTARLESFGGESPELPTGLYIVPPIPYLDFLRLLSASALVITDSGGMQEETTAMGIPCLTLREETERPITVLEGTNSLIGYDRDRLRREAQAALSGHGKKGRVPRLWDGKTAGRVVKHIAGFYQAASR